ncbi:unnamed protein product [Bursaphelenchus okinawaensis]|uniref:Protein polybromo-1 n=1 Tax=Bursaphelenchus okinawaensis TaxID=465554 RepID=A0A811JWE5_9BILA|nr:unnamed protein product [Bursaphelenchus okinawaensis]CAG9086709.1 unnamed protein product [Bursaphelenchus okinawaensis]
MSTKRRKPEDSITPGRKRARREPTVDQSGMCQSLFNALKAARDEEGSLISETFMRAPSRRADPEFHSTIQKPIDIGRISQKLNSDDYATFDEICDDFELLIKNSLSFYKGDSQERRHALALQKALRDEKEKILNPEEGTPLKTPKSEPVDPWRFQAVICAILDLTDKQGRLLCPPFRILAPNDKFPEYYEAIQNPIDLKRIAEKVDEYTSWKEFQDDLKLLFKNAKTFNEPGSVIYKDAIQLNQFANVKCAEFKEAKKITNKDANKNKEMIAELLSQSYEEDDDAISEDSDDDNQESVSDEMKKLYWKVRDFKKDGRELSENFMNLPEKVHYPDYYEEISDPMSFYLINKKMKQGKYDKIDELVQDIHKIFCNAMSYNVPQSDIYEDAAELEEVLINTVKQMGLRVDIKPFTDPPEEEEEQSFQEPAEPPRKPRKPKIEVVEALSTTSSSPQPVRDHQLSLTSDDNSNLEAPGSPKKKRGVPPSRLPTAIETRKMLIPKRSKRDPNGPRMKPGRKSFNEIRERYKLKLMEVIEGIQNLNENGRKLCKEFLYPPNRKAFPEYYVEIENPIDLTTIKHRIQNGDYKTSDEFLEDIKLMCRNARQFNEPGSQIYKDANTIEKHGQSLLAMFTNNTPLYFPPPSKNSRRQPTYFNGDLDEEGSYVYRQSPKIKRERPLPPTPQRLNGLQHHMLSILDAILSYQGDGNRILSEKFLRLPSKMEYPEYYEIIKKPMDLSRIRQRIVYKPYESLRLFLNELNLVFENACKFNEPESEIYRDAITLQKELMEIKAELFEESTVPSVQVQVKRILTNLLVYVNTFAENDRILAHSFADIKDLFAKNGIKVADMPFTFEQMKINVDKGRYRRLDRFQDDLFAFFTKIRDITAPTSQIFEDSIKLQQAFIQKRDELCKTVLVSPATTFNDSMLNDEIEAQKKEHRNKAKEEKNKDEKVAVANEENKEKVLDSVKKDGIKYLPGDYVYVTSDKERHIIKIQTIKDVPDEKELLISGKWVYKPSQTFHLATKKFYPHEVFLTPFTANITVERLDGKCVVMFVDDYVTSKPKDFDEKDIYLCHQEYLGRRQHFRRIQTWPFPDEAEKFNFEARPEELEVEKTETSEFISSEANKSTNDEPSEDEEEEEEDERMRGLPYIIEIPREEIVLKRHVRAFDDDEDADKTGEIKIEGSEPNSSQTVNGEVKNEDKKAESQTSEKSQENKDSTKDVQKSSETETNDDVVYYEQIYNAGHFYRHGDFVLVYNPKKPFCDVMRLEKIWQTPSGERYFSGLWFCRPCETTYEPSIKFYKKEVILVEGRDRVEPVERIQARCAVLSMKAWQATRPTEIPECDVFVLDHKVSGDPRDQENFMRYTASKSFRKIKQYPLSPAVPDDEIFYFKNPITMERELSSEVAKPENALPIDHHDLENEDRHVTEQLESTPALKDIAWLANQPKLNAKSKSGYILFSAEIRKRIMNENPEAGFGEVSKIVGVEWKKLTEEQKRQYEERANIIADARAKNDLLTPNSKVLQPGEIRVHVCKWHGCDFQFDHPDGCFEHIRVSHASADENKVIIDGEAHYACLWMTCVKYRQTGKPFPSLPRLLRHIREKHMPASGKVIQPSQKGKHFFHYLPQSEPSNNSTKEQSHGLFINQPNGVVTPNAVAHKTALPLDGPPTATTSVAYVSTPSTSAAAQAHTPQVYVQQSIPAQSTAHNTPHTSSHGTTQVVQVINGSNLTINGNQVAYLNGSSTPYQVIVNHQPQTIQAQPGQQIVVQHSMPSQQQQSHIVVHGSTPVQQGQYALHQPQTSTFQAPAPPKPEPLFVPPPNSIKTKRVLHSLTYFKYVENMNKVRQRVNGHERPQKLRSDQRKTLIQWLGRDENQRVRDDELTRALNRLRDDMLDSSVNVKTVELSLNEL